MADRDLEGHDVGVVSDLRALDLKLGDVEASVAGIVDFDVVEVALEDGGQISSPRSPCYPTSLRWV